MNQIIIKSLVFAKSFNNATKMLLITIFVVIENQSLLEG